MAAAKYKKYFEQMFEQNREQFMRFMLLNNAYGDDKPRFKQEFDLEGARVQQIVQEWEDRLCKNMERGDNSAYSAKLGEKFQNEVLKYFPHYHDIGVKIAFINKQ